MKAYSQDLRQRVLRAVDQGTPQAEIAKTFAISVPTIRRYLKQRRERGHVIPKVIPGRPSRCQARRALPDVGGKDWHASQSCQHQPRQSGSGMDAKKKTLRASEQN